MARASLLFSIANTPTPAAFHQVDFHLEKLARTVEDGDYSGFTINDSLSKSILVEILFTVMPPVVPL